MKAPQDVKLDAWIPLYVADWDGDTADLSCEEDGAYFRLVRHYWRRGAPADDDQRLARIVGLTLPRWRKMRPTLAPFFQIKNGFWFHKRVEAELVRWAERKQKYIDRAASGGRAKARKDGYLKHASSTTKAVLKGCAAGELLAGCTPTPTPSEENDSPTGKVILLQGASADSLPADDPRRAQAEAMTDEERRAAQAELRELAATLRTKRMPE